MNLSTQFIDKVAIGVSSLCIAHCLIFPLIAVIMPSIVALGLTSESFHFWMVISVIPSSIYALSLGCKKHKNISIVIIGLLGLSFLTLAIFLGHNLLGELGEKALTLIGSLLISFAHIKNFKLCHHQDHCKCSSENK